MKKDETILLDFYAGNCTKAYEYFGAHAVEDGVSFRVWAPSADKVYLCGDFNDWCETHEMTKVESGGVYEISLSSSSLSDYSLYKFKIINNGKAFFKADPFARFSQKPPETASVYIPESSFSWSDGAWMRSRFETRKERGLNVPINVYEIHLGSFLRHEDGSYFSYRELAPVIASYAKMMGYTHVELLPVAEHPNDASWGYQICSYFSPTSRFGSPDDFRFFINTLHNAGVGVILDWVPGHFPKDEHGLFEFDGSYLYEYNDPYRRESLDWETRFLDLSKNEVVSFLISNAVYWAQEFHADGIRVDAVSSMLYLDFGKKDNEWVPNKHGGNVNFEAVAFFKKLNRTMHQLFPDFLMIAEESSSFKGVTDTSRSGLGFDMKWNMGWMNDSLSFFSTPFDNRPDNHGKITFPMVYAFHEKHILPISHDEVVYGKRSLLDKMPGVYEQKFSGSRTFMTYMMTQPGKKLSFMSNEFGQFAEWNYARSVEWFMNDFELHRKLRDFSSDLNSFYLSNEQLWIDDFSWDGYEWVSCDDSKNSVISYLRKGKSGTDILCIFNLSDKHHRDYSFVLKNNATATLAFSSESEKYGGSGIIPPNQTNTLSKNGKYTITFDIPPLSAHLFYLKAQ